MYLLQVSGHLVFVIKYYSAYRASDSSSLVMDLFHMETHRIFITKTTSADLAEAMPFLPGMSFPDVLIEPTFGFAHFSAFFTLYWHTEMG